MYYIEYMKNKNFILTLVVITLLLCIGIYNQNKKFQNHTTQNEVIIQAEGTQPCIPTFLDGGGPYYEPNTPFRANIAPDSNQGTALTVRGKVLAADCKTPLANHILDVWQANESGNYEDSWYRGRVVTDSEGTYEFTTVIPKGYGEGTAFRPPHIHFKVWNQDKLLITSQMFLPESKNQGIDDAYIMQLTQSSDKTYLGEHVIVVPQL